MIDLQMSPKLRVCIALVDSLKNYLYGYFQLLQGFPLNNNSLFHYLCSQCYTTQHSSDNRFFFFSNFSLLIAIGFVNSRCK